MSDRESLFPHDWLSKAEADMQTTEILLAHAGDMGIAAMHVQQAVEKFLKGYLLSRGWTLERIHDLPVLLDEAVKHTPELEAFRTLCEEVTVFYFVARYPFPVTPPAREEVEDIFRLAQDLARRIEEII